MRAARLYGVGDIRVEDVPEPPVPRGDEVLLQVETAGICGSDLHNFHTGMWISRSPSIPGHEFVATVAAVGDDVRSLKPGDRVVADSRVPCGTCAACTGGRPYLCPHMGFVGEVNDGGFAPLSLQREHQLIRLPDQSIDRDIAALCEPLAVALHAVNRLALSPDSAILVGGAGTIGALATAVLRHRGFTTVRLADLRATRRDAICAAFGAEPFEPGNAAVVDGYIDTTGAAAALATGLGAVRRGGHVAVVGLYKGDIQVDMNAIVEGGLTLAGCAAFDGELVDATRLLPEMMPLLKHLPVTHVSIDEVPPTYRRLLAGELDVQKVFVRPS